MIPPRATNGLKTRSPPELKIPGASYLVAGDRNDPEYPSSFGDGIDLPIPLGA